MSTLTSDPTVRIIILVGGVFLGVSTDYFAGPSGPLIAAVAMVLIYAILILGDQLRSQGMKRELLTERTKLVGEMRHQEKNNARSRNGPSSQNHRFGGQLKPNAHIRFSDAMYTDNVDEMDMLDGFGAHSVSGAGAVPHLKKRQRERTLYTGRRKGKRKDQVSDQKSASQSPTTTETPA